MTKRRTSRGALVGSLISLLLCFAVLAGTTYAWFTDSTESGVNMIVAGNLDVELFHNNGSVTADEKVTATTDLFNVATWEPGTLVYENFRIENPGTLPLRFEFYLSKLIEGNYNTVTWGGDTAEYKLSDVLKIAVIANDETCDGDNTANSYTPIANNMNEEQKQAFIEGLTLSAWTDPTTENMTLLETKIEGEGDNRVVYSLEPGKTKSFSVVIYWEPTASDNKYNLQGDGWSLAPAITGHTDDLFAKLGITLYATQTGYSDTTSTNP